MFHTLSITQKGLSFLSIVALMGLSRLPVYAADNVCFCHNINNNPITVCTDNQGLINGHQGHVESGSDTLGACTQPTATPTPTPTPTPEQPSVPEFGLMTGLFSLAASAGSYYFLKRRNA